MRSKKKKHRKESLVTDSAPENETIKLPSPLFDGEPKFGSLSNEQELCKSLPRVDKRWEEMASDLFFRGGTPSNWKWKPLTMTQRARALRCIRAALGSFQTKHEHKTKLTGWMLSEVLEEPCQ